MRRVYYANRWFIQWAGFTIGHSTSFYDFYSIGANQYGSTVACRTAATAAGTCSPIPRTSGRLLGLDLGRIVAPDANHHTSAAAASAGPHLTAHRQQAPATKATNIPDLVGNLRVDQAWGSAQVMGACTHVAADYYGHRALSTTGHPGDEVGFAVGAGIKLKADAIAKGDYFEAEADYTQGALRYLNMFGNSFNWSNFTQVRSVRPR